MAADAADAAVAAAAAAGRGGVVAPAPAAACRHARCAGRRHAAAAGPANRRGGRSGGADGRGTQHDRAVPAQQAQRGLHHQPHHAVGGWQAVCVEGACVAGRLAGVCRSGRALDPQLSPTMPSWMGPPPAGTCPLPLPSHPLPFPRRDAFTLNMLEIPQGEGSGFVYDK